MRQNRLPANELAIDYRYSRGMLRTLSLFGSLAPVCALAAIILGYRVPSAPQDETADLGPAISEMQRTFSQADVTGSIATMGVADMALSGDDLFVANKISHLGDAKHRRKVVPNHITSYKPDISPPNFTNSAY